MPIIVGGTNYYIEALLWKILIDDDSNETSGSGVNRSEDESVDEYEVPKKKWKEREDDTNFTNEQLHNELAKIDQQMALRLHPNDRRKVIR